ncbi:S-adenosylmethionine:tRNA ribosyltransferase-isomerase [Anaerosporomusa subterranea]|uniref:S-adenosylmethionine:tRNA ribosyltransferase-isomerase n=1 Tax=Anaerosporomusa subterranea TaxID=1794912 RepID=A0A154BU69_ANASB|nr:tRNA preQ1(34) S-adenosylmethionine ribosyltransferase-isomerase QueA [Anaerosporomusa subterranea]KYZ77574.1 S-adenosylmethionine:tRNA ribosyltransferase-isomerase [Anaerosporomusa subterranea]
MKLSEFDYDLPEQLIAQHPIEPRDSSRLLVLDRASTEIRHGMFKDLLEYISPGDTLVFNDTRVIPARLMGRRADTGGQVEVFLLSEKTEGEWEVLVKPGKRAKPGMVIEFGPELSCEVLSGTDFGGRVVRFAFSGIFAEILDRLGETPLPPYIHERLSDSERYQTVYSRQRGSAAAPTAGLHFTPALLSQIKEKGARLAFITLHVGLGTFRPVAAEDITDHVMHREYFSVSEEAAEAVNQAKEQGGRVIAVGTTSIRTLETAVRNGRLSAGSGWTEIFIYPGYQFQLVDGIITNFHLPKSTLIMLISAFAGRERVLAAYKEAVQREYRFFSFGDAMLLL